MSFWRTDPPVMEGTRVMQGGMFPSQKTWWDLPNFVRLFVGGYGSGKTLTLCKRAIALSLYNAPIPVAFVSPTFAMARETTCSTMDELLEGKKHLYAQKGEEFHWTYHKSHHTWTIVHKNRVGRVILYSGEYPDRLKGTNLAAAMVDEPFIQDVAVFEQMVARLRHPKAKKLELNLGGTPEQLNWGYDLVKGELGEGYDVGHVTASTRENVALDPEYVERLISGYDDLAGQAYVDGEFVNLSTGRVFHTFNEDSHVLNIEPQPGVHWGAGMDFNVNPMAFCVFWYDANRQHMHVVQEFEVPNSDTTEACKLIRNTWPHVDSIYPDPTGNKRQTNAKTGITDHLLIKEAGFRLLKPRSPWPRRDSYNSVNGAFKKRVITLAPQCKRLTHYLQAHTHEQMLQQESMTHLLDAFRYPATYLFPMLKPSTQSRRLVA